MDNGTPPFVKDLLGIRGANPNTADSHSLISVAIAKKVLELLNLTTTEGPTDPGPALEGCVKDFLLSALPASAPSKVWEVSRRKLITDFEQYAHLGKLKALTDADPMLRAEIGQDYLVAPDVTVGILTGGQLPFLHAAVSCKWTIRSDRVQNIRHEGVILTRHRRGRQPHVVTVTAEPLPSRLASIARGTGEVDAVYHICLSELVEATETVAPPTQQAVLTELISQRRLFDFQDLLTTLCL